LTVHCALILAEVLAAAPAGRLEICPEHPYAFRDGERHIALVGVSDRSLLAIWENEKGFSWRRCLDTLEANRINYVRVDVAAWGELRAHVEYPAQFSRPAWPFARTGPGMAADGGPRFDLSRFDSAYFEERLRPFLRETARRGIYVELTLFDDPRGRGFSESLWADGNNIHGFGLRAGEATCDGVLERPALLAIQEAFVRKILDETAPFGHTILEIANETGGSRWVAHMIDLIHADPRRAGRLVSAGEQTSPFDPVRGSNDIVVKHRGGAGPYATRADVRAHRDALIRFRAGKPVTHNEYFLFARGGTSDLNFARWMMWADFTAGGHSNLYDFTFFRGTGRTVAGGDPSRAPPPEILRGAKHLLEFIEREQVPFWEMEPNDASSSVKADGEAHIFTFAREGMAYLSYILGEGPVTVAVALGPGRFAARWFDPKDGGSIGPAVEIAGTGRREFRTPAFSQDIVLYVRRRGADP